MTTPALIICSRVQASRLLTTPDRAKGVSHIVSIGASWEKPPEGYDSHPGPKLRLTFDDTTVSKGSRVAPGRKDIRSAIGFAEGIVDGATGEVLVHCGEGQSRAPAVAYVMLCTWLGPGREREALAKIRGIKIGVVPNPRVVELGDELLGRGGSMIRALKI